MNNILNKLIVFLLVCLAFPYPGSSQDSLANEVRYEVSRICPFVAISVEQLKAAHTLSDLGDEVSDFNHYYQSSWIREYISVEILTRYKGEIRKAESINDTLSREQKDNMLMADAGADISVRIQYIPENTLSHNDPKEIDFSFTVKPEREAKFPGGSQSMKQYLEENIVDLIQDESFRKYELAAVKFTINEEGKVIDAHVFESAYQTYENEEMNEFLLEAIRHMPRWTPAAYANDTKVKQEFVFTVGDMESCVINLLGICRS